MQITSIYSKITNCSYKTAYACTHATRHLAISETHSRYHETCTNSPNNKNILASRDATAEKPDTIDQFIQSNFNTIRKKTQNYKQITKNSKRVESIVHDNLVKNGNKQSSRDKQELATWKCKYDELNAAVQKLSTETPV